ncbi:MAG: hypothetical protein LBE91_14650 [Tannerella sp.]|jgi:hypothetical protein|nr:hypothetical protein [Tannerella sp.]
MEWREIKTSIQDSLNSRGLKNPNIRLNALDNIEALIRKYFPEYLRDTKTFPQDKDFFKRVIEGKKGKDLNGAEHSVINEIYYRL